MQKSLLVTSSTVYRATSLMYVVDKCHAVPQLPGGCHIDAKRPRHLSPVDVGSRTSAQFRSRSSLARLVLLCYDRVGFYRFAVPTRFLNRKRLIHRSHTPYTLDGLTLHFFLQVPQHLSLPNCETNWQVPATTVAKRFFQMLGTSIGQFDYFRAHNEVSIHTKYFVLALKQNPYNYCLWSHYWC